MTYIGIDPAFRKNGFAICLINNGVVQFIVFKSFIDFHLWILTSAPSEAMVAIENSNLQKALFDRKGNAGTVIAKAMAVGKNKAISELTVLACLNKYPSTTFEFSPKEKGGKWTDTMFRGVMRMEKHTLAPKTYKGNDNEQDKRDAYQVALLAIRQKKVVKK